MNHEVQHGQKDKHATGSPNSRQEKRTKAAKRKKKRDGLAKVLID